MNENGRERGRKGRGRKERKEESDRHDLLVIELEIIIIIIELYNSMFHEKNEKFLPLFLPLPFFSSPSLFPLSLSR